MIDGALPVMIDEILPAPCKMSETAVDRTINRGYLKAPAHLKAAMHGPAAPSLFDQTALIDLAERLVVQAARAAGADAADAVAVRSMSLSIEVRDGAVEESERAEGDDLGLRVLVGRTQAVVSTNDMSRDGIAALAERAVAMARAAPDDKFAGLADENLLAHDFPDLDLIDRDLPIGAAARNHGARSGSSRPLGQGRHQIRRRVGLGRHRRHGAGHQPRLPRRLSRLAPRSLDDRDRRRRHRHGARLRFLLGAACLRPRSAGEDRPHRRRARSRAAQPAQGHHTQSAGGVRSTRSPIRWCRISPAP